MVTDLLNDRNIEKWKVESSRETYSDQWLTLRTDNCRTSCGSMIEDYHVLEFPHWVNIVALTPENRLILTAQYRHGVGEVLLELPCGAIDDSDSSPLQAALRELKEETGYVPDRTVDLGWCYANPARQNNKVYTILALNAQKKHSACSFPSEKVSVVEEKLSIFLYKMLRVGELQGLHQAAILRAVSFVQSSTEKELAKTRETLRAI